MAKQLYVNFEDMVELAIQGDGTQLVQVMEDRFCHGSMSFQLKERITALYDNHNKKQYAPHKMIFLILISSDFQIQE